jgi:SOS-response transcriptional repressor LexA
MMAIIARERQVLDVIKQYHQRHGYGPSYRDIQRLANIKSTVTTKHIVNDLIAKGYLLSTPGVARSLRLTEKGSGIMGVDDYHVSATAVQSGSSKDSTKGGYIVEVLDADDGYPLAKFTFSQLDDAVSFMQLCFANGYRVLVEADSCEEVIPAIRKHGMYATPQAVEVMLQDKEAE